MNKESLYKLAKIQNDDKIVLIKNGTFYKSYENDAILIWSLFGYRVIEGRTSFPISVFGSIISKITRLGMSVVVINTEEDINNYTSTGENTYETNMKEALEKYETDGKVNEIKLLVEDKIKTSFINYDKLIEFINTL